MREQVTETSTDFSPPTNILHQQSGMSGMREGDVKWVKRAGTAVIVSRIKSEKQTHNVREGGGEHRMSGGAERWPKRIWCVVLKTDEGRKFMLSWLVNIQCNSEIISAWYRLIPNNLGNDVGKLSVWEFYSPVKINFQYQNIVPNLTINIIPDHSLQ